jgi:hypothetical protein
MSTIYVAIKCAKESTGEFVMATTEMAFSTEEAARAWIATKEVVWEETINGALAYCERAIHITQLV